MLPRCNTDDLDEARSAFANERLILTAESEWTSTGEVFQHADDNDVPDAPVIHPQVRQFSMWTRLGVADRPSLELVLRWVQSLDPGSRLDPQDAKRVRGFLRTRPVKVWQELGHWLSLDGTWEPISQLSFRLTMQGLTKWSDLFPSIKARTANLQMLPAEVCEQPPFSTLPNLAACVQYRITQREHNAPSSFCQHWLLAFAQGLLRVKLKDEDQTLRVWEVAERLSRTVWQPFRAIRITPFVDNTPAGQPHAPQVLWDELTLYVHDGPLTKLFKPLVDELARPFGMSEITEAIRTCIDRTEAWIEDYLAATFELMPAPVKSAPKAESDAAPESTESSESEISNDKPQATDDPESGDDDADAGEDVGDLVDNESDADVDDPDDSAENEPTRATRDRKPRTDPTLIAQYAALKGYRWSDALNRYQHSDGTWIEKAEGTFNWQKISATGVVIRRYWVSEQCLMSGGIELAAELWELVKNYTGTAGLILKSQDGRPHEFSGDELVKMVDGGALKLYPANYRLRRPI